MAKKIDKYRAMDVDELVREQDALREQVWRLRQQLATGQLDRPTKLTEARRNLARVLTLVRERELAQG